LNLYRDFAKGAFSETGFALVLDVLENFMIRRWVCGVPTYGLNKIFPPLYAQASAGRYRSARCQAGPRPRSVAVRGAGERARSRRRLIVAARIDMHAQTASRNPGQECQEAVCCAALRGVRRRARAAVGC